MRRWFVKASARGAADSGNRTDVGGVGAGGDAFVTADLLAGVGWSSGGRRMGTFTLGLTNLFDADYTEPYARLPAAGRSFVASFSIEF